MTARDDGRCRHGVHHDKCYECLPDGTSVYAFVRRNPDGVTLEEIGEIYGVTRERVRQIETEAMRKIREDEPASRKLPRAADVDMLVLAALEDGPRRTIEIVDSARASHSAVYSALARLGARIVKVSPGVWRLARRREARGS